MEADLLAVDVDLAMVEDRAEVEYDTLIPGHTFKLDAIYDILDTKAGKRRLRSEGNEDPVLEAFALDPFPIDVAVAVAHGLAADMAGPPAVQVDERVPLELRSGVLFLHLSLLFGHSIG